MAAHQPPADNPIEAHEERAVWTRKVRATQFGTSCASHVSTWACPGPPFAHSVSTPVGNSSWGETMSAERIRFAATASAITLPSCIVSIHCAGVPG
jgi:hypothetical protein